jgi:SAM-dependent methyltransferase
VADQDPAVWARRSSSFGAAARAYAEHRPDYAAEAVAWCLAGAERPVVDVLDLGAGTGVLTTGLVASGLSVTAVEPDPEMIAELRRRLPEVRAAAGRAEAVPLPDDSVDAVLVGTAFHWFDTERALPEIARVLRPGGVLGLLYNLIDDSVPWVAELDEVSRSSVSIPPGEADEVPSYAGFGPVEQARFAHRHRRTAESMTATIGTHSHTLVVSAEERADLLSRVRAFLDSQPETSAGTFDHPLVTLAGRCLVA